jgi:formylglycine-generating enzyme required for sulfatase activity
VAHCAEFGRPRLVGEEQEAVLRLIDFAESDLLIGVASIIEARLGAPDGAEWRRWLSASIGQLQPERREVLDAIHAMGVPIVTTNYDGLLEATAPGTRAKAVTWLDPAACVKALRGEDAAVVHLHGSWERPESVVLGAGTYQRVHASKAAQEIQASLARFTSFLFIGCGRTLEDPNIGGTLRALASSGPPEHRHYAVVLDGELDSYADLPSVSAIPYGPSHDFLVPFLREVIAPATAVRSVVRGDPASLVAAGATFREIDDPDLKLPRMVAVEPGSCLIGQHPDEAESRPEELPSGRVTIEYKFAVSESPVTFAEWEAFRAVHGGAPPRDWGWGRGQMPVIDITWDDALAYCEWLSSLNGVVGRYRLLSEAEWEYVARAGSETIYWWGNDPREGVVNCDGSGIGKPVPVDQTPHAPNGVRGMLGNVWEWVADAYAATHDRQPGDGSAVVDAEEDRRVVKGGCWYYDYRLAQPSARLGIERTVRFNSVGFRVARSVRQEVGDGGVYRIECASSMLVLTWRGVGSGVTQERANGEESQRWRVQMDGPGDAVRFESCVDGSLLAAANASGRNEVPVIATADAVSAETRWRLAPEGDGYVVVNAGSGKVLDVDGMSAKPGARVIQFARHGNANQRWGFRPTGGRS